MVCGNEPSYTSDAFIVITKDSFDETSMGYFALVNPQMNLFHLALIQSLPFEWELNLGVTHGINIYLDFLTLQRKGQYWNDFKISLQSLQTFPYYPYMARLWQS